jgi:hypothetical protein
MLCHGQGDERADPFEGGCCYVNGAICSARWFIDYSTSSPAEDVGTATIRDSNRNSLGTVAAYVDSLMPGGGPTKTQRIQRVLDQVDGIKFVCSAAAYVIGMDPSLINDRPAFEAAWAANAAYTPIAAQWVAMGKPANWCMTFGPSEGQCCFGEDQATNDSKRANITTTAVTVRSQAPGAI